MTNMSPVEKPKRFGGTFLAFFAASAVMLGVAAAVYTKLPDPIEWQHILILFLFLSFGSILFVYPFLLHHNYVSATAIKDRLQDIKHTVLDAENVLRTHSKLLMAVQSLNASVEETVKKVEMLHNMVLGSISNAKQREAELQEARYQVERYAKREEQWVDTMIEFADYLHRLLSMLPPDDERYAIVKKIVTDLSRYASRNSFEIIAPDAETPFIAELHEAVGQEPAKDATAETTQVVRCEKWGYRYGGVVRSRARVIVAAPAEAASANASNYQP